MASFSRKELEALGVVGEQQDNVIDLHRGVITALNTKIDALESDVKKYKAEADKIPDLEKQVKEAEQHKANADKFKADYEAEKAAHDKLKSDNAAQAETAKKTAALKKLLKDSGYHEKGIDLVTEHTDLSSFEIDENGTFKDAEKITAGIEEKWGIFKGKTEKFEHVPQNQPNNGGGSNQPSRAAQIAQRVHENLYGKSE